MCDYLDLFLGDLIYFTLNTNMNYPSGFRIDKERTTLARENQGKWWKPLICIKE